MPYPAGSLDIEAVKLGIFQWVQEVTQGIIGPDRIIWRDQSQPLPKRPCVTMKIIDGPTPTDRNASLFFGPKPGQTPVTDNQSPSFNYGIQMEMTVSIQVFGNSKIPSPRALQLSLDLNSSLIRQSILDKLKKSGVSIQGRGRVKNLTALEESEYEERAGFDIEMGLVQNISDQPGTIEKINLEVETPAGTQTREIDLT